MKSLKNIDIEEWNNFISEDIKNESLESLESGKVLFFPALSFSLNPDEQRFLDPKIVDPKTKNISFDARHNRLGGTLCEGEEASCLKKMIERYATTSRCFLEKLLPQYAPFLAQAKTSFRPVEISGRKNPSYRKDDTLLHVDSFPSNPTKGQRILRIFTNINLEGKPRVWHIGEPFEDVVKKIAPRTSKPIWGTASLLKLLKITKDYRTAYDHYMLQIHDTMKGDASYQKNVPKEEVLFPAGSSWIVFTDKTSHAAMSGQHVLEQTFNLPVNGMKKVEDSPLKILERFYQKTLI
jgi:3-deoxy-D-manno-oct-2-ulosonic acid (Kdo) hydroxylase